MKKHLLITLLILISLAWPLLAQSPGPAELVQTANQQYEAGDYAQAADLYQQAIAAGAQHSLVFYNLGNAYFKQADLGRAILNYRRAQRLSPRDADIRTNLALAQAQTARQVEAGSLNPLDELVDFTQYWFTLNEMALIALGLWFLFALLVVVYSWQTLKRGRSALQYLIPFVGILLFLSVISLGGRLYFEANRPAAVVIAPQTNVTSGPGEQYITEFSLTAGTEVNIIESREHWLRIALPGSELQGWLPLEAVTLVQESTVEP